MTMLRNYMAYWFERAVDEQKKELKDYKKKLKAQESLQIEPVPIAFEQVDLSEQIDREKSPKACVDRSLGQ